MFRRGRQSYTQDLERDNWVVIHVAKGSTFPILVPNICNEKVAQALAAKFESSGIIILAVCSAGDLADRLRSGFTQRHIE